MIALKVTATDKPITLFSKYCASKRKFVNNKNFLKF